MSAAVLIISLLNRMKEHLFFILIAFVIASYIILERFKTADRDHSVIEEPCVFSRESLLAGFKG